MSITLIPESSTLIPSLTWLYCSYYPTGVGSIPGQSMWDSCWTKWHVDRSFSSTSRFSC